MLCGTTNNLSIIFYILFVKIRVIVQFEYIRACNVCIFFDKLSTSCKISVELDYSYNATVLVCKMRVYLYHPFCAL